MNRKFLERLMYFKRQAENRVYDLEERLKGPQSVCKVCDATSDSRLTAQLSEAQTTVAYLSGTLDAYWSAHGAA